MSNKDIVKRLTFVQGFLESLATHDENKKALKREIIALEKAIDIVKKNESRERIFMILWTTIFWTGFFLVASIIY